MRYLLLIYNAPETWERTSPSDRQEITEAYIAFTKEIAESGELLGGEPLQGLETATTVRVRGGKTATTDGPFAETKEVLGGYYLVDAMPISRIGRTSIDPVAASGICAASSMARSRSWQSTR